MQVRDLHNQGGVTRKVVETIFSISACKYTISKDIYHLCDRQFNESSVIFFPNKRLNGVKHFAFRFVLVSLDFYHII